MLWCAVKAIQDEKPKLDFFIYTGDHDASPQSLMSRATDRFGIHLAFPPKVCQKFYSAKNFNLIFLRDWIA